MTRRFYLTTGLLVLLFLASAGLLLGYLGYSLDRQSAGQSAHLAETALRQLEATDRSHAYDFAFWDDTVAFTRGQHDRAWADQNTGLWSMRTYGFTDAFIVAANDRPLYSAVRRPGGGDAVDSPPPQELLGSGLGALLAAARAAPMNDPTPVSAYLRQGETVFLAVAAAITPEYPTPAELERQPRPVLVYARQLDATLLADLGSRYLLPDLRLVPAAEAAPGDRRAGRLALAGPDGGTVATLAWTPARPSVAALRRAALPAGIVLLLLLLLGGVMVVAARRAGRTIAGTLVALERSNAELVRGERAARAARDEAERANRVKTVFLANVSHELRTPLNAILGFAEILRHQLKGPLGHPAYRGYAEDIHASGEHLLRLIDNVIDLSRIEAGAWELAPAPVDLRGATEEVLRFLQPLARQRGVELAVDLSATPGSIVADSRAVAQIVTNLVGNAIKFTDSGGSVRVRWSRGEHGAAILEVADTGVGIAADDLQAIVLPFERGRDPATRRREGSGLGLAIVKSLVDLHGGRLEIDSAPGRGTRVTVALPGQEDAVAA
ncbi:sensor histidine kinase [Tistlia consotensis]|uniref:sensor histidine kinase n=1 Tax=Tistlia consotensis TaxID=1321365 RepID=UPI0013564607|nr:ATP-binding protein [Tistlia consotensis]